MSAATTTVMSDRACQCCGVDPLAVACEALVVRALEVLGKRIVRSSRGPHRDAYHAGERQWHEAHLDHRPSPSHVDATLAKAWDLVPDVCRQWGEPDPDAVADRLDWYTRWLIRCRELPTAVDVARVLGVST